MNKSHRILIAEDESIIAKDIAKTLESLSYVVLGITRTGKDIIRKASELKPDLVLMDIKLEGEMSGIEAAHFIMSNYNIPVVYLTAFADNDTLERAKVTEPFGYILKPFDDRSLHSSIEMAIYKHEITCKLKERTEELRSEKEKTDKLLQNILPITIINEFKEKGIIAPRHYENVTLLFTDFEDFTRIASKMPPHELVDELNEIFKAFDSIINKYDLEKLKTIGDSYMVGGGFPVESTNHAQNIIFAAFEMMQFIEERNKISKCEWKMRAGVHSGNIIAGVVGKNKFTYDVWGNTVNIASKMERQGVPGKINITSATMELVKDLFDFEYQGKIEIPGNGLMEMYFVINSKCLDNQEVNIIKQNRFA